ncbi:uncharacterized protein BP5553_03086 [Venustampulla echinocandica]|uniref:Membrane insertase YidC/Oxa/ALB C-terminal domain-containing protein n=1 Tax=Venustampulla echinocandica TaxID=2656787 RepID=A0A370TT84_9HELO|nr:uncharacterized protein BP5553_03086 [Venustampulla echinocandica]RDL38746.1 hypothetical protein BP5553_03086 [Venustampulla echinocandica]
MIPSRGLRWSGQSVGLARRQIGAFSTRQFSSVQHRPISGNTLLSRNATSLLGGSGSSRAQLPKTNLLIRNATSIRLASTTPQPSPAPSATVSNAAPITPDQAASSATTSSSELASSLDDSMNLTSDGLPNIAEHIGYLKSLGLDYGWGPTSMMEWTLEHIHIFAETPWWGSIALTAILVRILLFKPYVDAAENAARMVTIQHIIKPLAAKMNAARIAGDTTAMLQHRTEITRINKRAGISPLKSFVPMIQGFAAYGTFRLLRGMAALPVPGLQEGGLAWFYNLTIPDPYFILPLATAGVLHWLMRRGGETGTSTLSPAVQKAMQWGFPGLSLAFTWWLPAGVQLSFFVSGLLSFVQASLLRIPSFRRIFNMTPLPEQPSTTPISPYKGTINVAKSNIVSSGPNSPLEKTSANFPRPPATGIGKYLAPALKPFQEIKEQTKGVMDMANEKMDARREKSERGDAQKYEEKRQRELKREKWEREQRSRDERAARKAARKSQ